MEKEPDEIPDETTPPQETPLLVAEALAERSGLPLSEFDSLTREQLDTLFDDLEFDQNLYDDPAEAEAVRQKNTDMLRRRIGEMRSARP